MSGARSHLTNAAVKAGLLALLVTIALCAAPGRSVAAGNTIASPDSGGQYTSIALDALGAPVISHYDPATGDLKIAHCGTPSCTSSNTLTSPDTTNNVGQYTSLKLDANGRPVVSYYDASLFDLKVLHCGDATCASGNTIQSPGASILDTTGYYTSLALDSSGNPVVSHYTVPNDGLKLTHCGDPACNTSSNNFADPGNILGYYTSLALDASGFPVISYFDQTNGDLKVVHCGNANCASGNTIVSPDMAGEVGEYTSIALDSLGKPVVSYYDRTGGKLKILHCGDATCSSGNSITMPDGAGASYTSIRLDAFGDPVVSYYSTTGANLRVMHCGDPNCSIGNVAVAADSTGNVGQYSSLTLDASGNPVVSYYDATNGMLKVLHCSDANCTAASPPTPTPPATAVAVGGFTTLPDVTRPGGEGGIALWLGLGALATLLLVAGVIVRRRRAG